MSGVDGPDSDPPCRTPARPSSEEQLAAFRALHVVTKRMHASLDLTATLDAVAQGVVEGAGFGVAAVNLARPDGDFVVVSVAGDAGAREALMGTVATAEKWRQELERSEELGQLRYVDGRHVPLLDDMFVWVPDVPLAHEDPDAWHPLNALYAPLTAASGQMIGVLSVDLPVSGRRPEAWQLEILELFADHAAIAIQHARLHSALREQEAQARHAATHDALTGLANRAALAAAERIASGHGVDLAVIVIDLDGFKTINDTRGHSAGDDVLRVIAHRLRESIRGADVIARIGGDEFAVVLSGRDAFRMARSLVNRLPVEIAQPIQSRYGVHHVGASIGLALDVAPIPLSELLSRADAAMYERKRTRADAAGY